MDVDRRHLIAGLGGLAVAGCSKAQIPADKSSPADQIAGRAVERKISADRNTVAAAWTAFKARFVDTSGRIIDTGNGGISHSEGQSYALIMAVEAGDRSGFDQVFRWTNVNLGRPDIALYSWRFDPRQSNPVEDRNNATDADLMIAFALKKAADRWGSAQYVVRANGIMDAIAKHLTRTIGGRLLLLPGLEGFSKPARTTINPSYYVWPALDQFARAEGGAVWRKVVSDGEGLLTAARFGPHALPTDWIDVSNSGSISPAAVRPARFGFDAIRVPLYASVTGREALIAPIRSWWQTLPAERIPAWVDVVSSQTAEYPLSPGGQSVVRRALSRKRLPLVLTDYYSSALQCLECVL